MKGKQIQWVKLRDMKDFWSCCHKISFISAQIDSICQFYPPMVNLGYRLQCTDD